MNLKHRALVAYVLVILVVTGLPGGNQTILATGWDKIAHGLMFLVLGMLSSWTVPKKHVMVITGGFLLAGVTETLQLIVPGRSFEMMDLAADGLGVAIGWGVFQLKRSAAGES